LLKLFEIETLVLPGGQYLPLPYVPSIARTDARNFSLSFGSAGAPAVNEFFQFELRSDTGSSAKPPEDRSFLRPIAR